MGRWKGKGGRKIEKNSGKMKWQGREKGWRSVNIKKINVKKIIRKLKKKKKNPKAWKVSNFFFFPLSWKDSHKTLKLNRKIFGLG